MGNRGTAAGDEPGRVERPRPPHGPRRRRRQLALALSALLLLLAATAAAVAARPGRTTALDRSALLQQRRAAAQQQRAAALEQRAAARRASLEAARQAREAKRAPVIRVHREKGRHPHHGHGNERPNAIVTSTCRAVNWTFRRFNNMPNNTITERITIAHMAPKFETARFDGEGAVVLSPINPPPGKSRIDTGAKWKTNGLKGGFDIHSRKQCPPAPAFTIEKKQRMGTSASFTAQPLIGLVGQIVEYEMIVRNTGNVPLVLSNFTDAHCDAGTIQGGRGATPLQPASTPDAGESTTYTCSHQLTSTEKYENSASVTATPPPGDGSALTQESNTVVVNGPLPPVSLTIEKRQKIEGEYTTSPLSGKVGQTVEYEIIVTDTGTTSLTLSGFSDAGCEAITGGPSKALVPEESTTYFCHHLLTSADQTAGSHVNEASVTGTPPEGAPVPVTSNKVIVTLQKPGGESAFTIEKRQKIEGEYTTSPLSGKVGQTVEYEIIVKDTGTTSLTLSGFGDAGCEAITGGPSKALVPEESTTYFCHHLLTSADQTATSHVNEASVTGTPPEGAPITHTSNKVVVTLSAPPPPSSPVMYLAYADTSPNDHGGSSGAPNPWKGSAGVTFAGCGFGGKDSCPTSGGVDLYDAGAIRIEATAGSGPVAVSAVSVTIGPCKYEPWPGLNVTVQPGQSLILTQTGTHRCTSVPGTEQDNFDTSESFLASPQYQQFLKTGKCTGDGYIPAITLTLNGSKSTVNDSGQVLNGGGQDADICKKASEAVGWVKLAPLSTSATRQASAVRRPGRARHRRRWAHRSAARASSVLLVAPAA